MKCYIKDYPRPQFMRTDWENLNGTWDFGFDDENAGEKEKWKQRPVNEKVWNPAAREFYMKYVKADPPDGEPGTEENEPE